VRKISELGHCLNNRQQSWVFLESHCKICRGVCASWRHGHQIPHSFPCTPGCHGNRVNIEIRRNRIEPCDNFWSTANIALPIRRLPRRFTFRVTCSSHDFRPGAGKHGSTNIWRGAIWQCLQTTFNHERKGTLGLNLYVATEETGQIPKHKNEQWHRQHQYELLHRKDVRGNKHHTTASLLKEVCSSWRWRLWQDMSVD
jgi:hypothetical protein